MNKLHAFGAKCWSIYMLMWGSILLLDQETGLFATRV